MAIDEAVLRARIAGTAPPTVRFFGWGPPAVSLGYGQPLDGAIDQDACARLGIGLVRRPTGGSAILHESPAAELTYSVVARADDFPGAEDVLETYRTLGTALAAGLARLGVPAEVVPLARRLPGAAPTFCFARVGAYELAVDGRKIAGSAQRRQAGTFLQHGSLLLDVDPARLRAVFPGVVDPLAGVTTLRAAANRPVGFAEAVTALRVGFAATLAPLEVAELSRDELESAGRLATEKYATDAWTRHGGALAPQHA
jgi:lipoate-protein ligase A